MGCSGKVWSTVVRDSAGQIRTTACGGCGSARIETRDRSGRQWASVYLLPPAVRYPIRRRYRHTSIRPMQGDAHPPRAMLRRILAYLGREDSAIVATGA